jgi:cyclic pyranopterin phosphate synthase
MDNPQPSHFDREGRARMVDVGEKVATHRRARARGYLNVSQGTLTALSEGDLPKGDPLETARLAAISAAKKTSDLIPLCHPLRLTHVDVTITPERSHSRICVETSADAVERTGVEMEALTACTVALLTIYDMLKAIDREMELSQIRLIEKTGGKSDYHWSGSST